VVIFVEENRSWFEVEPILDVLQFAPSTYCACKSRPPSERPRDDAVLKVEITRVHRVHRVHHDVYGVRKVS
jgi:hypothetical protein